MVPDAQPTRIPRRNGSQAAATPFLVWRHRRGDSAAGEVAPVSARKLAASLWHLAATGSVGLQCDLSFDRLGFEFCSSLPIPKMEGATKWDSCHSKPWDCANDNVKLSSAAFAGQADELFKSRKYVNEGVGSKAKMKYSMRKINEERAQHQIMCSVIINNLAKGIKSERKICENIDKSNSDLLHDIAEAKLSAMEFIRNLEKEKKAREELEVACYDLATEIEARKAEIWALRNEQKRIQLEVEEERKMLQMAEVWREEQTQMKLADAYFILEDKYAEINHLIADLKAFLTSSNSTAGLNVAEILRQGFGLVNINGSSIKDFKCSIPESDNASAVTKTSEAERRSGCHDQAHCASYAALKKGRPNRSSVGGFEEMSSGVETVIQGEGSVNKIRTTYVSNCNAASNREAHQKSEGSEICSVSLMQPKPKTKGSSSCRNEGANWSSNRSISSTAGRNPHVVRAMNGHVEWPWRMPRHGLAGNLLEAKLESQRMLLRNVLKN